VKRALITGITGQDGSYLAELLLEKGYQVHGLIRRSSSLNTGRIDHIYQDPHDTGTRLFLHYCDLSDAGGLRKAVDSVRPHEVYNLGAQSHVRVSFDQPLYTADVTGLGTLRLLDAIRDYMGRSGDDVRYYQASSSEMFGSSPAPQSMSTPFHPRSPYACAKVFSYWQTINYREAYGIHASNGVLFNHESPRRGETFVTRKITRAVGRIAAGLQKKLYLGNTDAKRDWGHARDFVSAMWLMLQQDEPGDYIVATGATHSVLHFVRAAFDRADLDFKDYLEIDPRYFRPSEVDVLCGDASATTEVLGWVPETTCAELINEMVDHDLDLARREKRANGV
jgi:GDPmannose 4,6-dehydratase